MKNILRILILTISISTFGQNIELKEVTGKWKTLEVETSMKNIDAGYKEIMELFKNSEFNFIKNNSFELKTPNGKMPEFSEMFINTKWIYKKEDGIIKIGTEQDDFSTMEIRCETNSNGIYFYILESTLILKMEKMNP